MPKYIVTFLSRVDVEVEARKKDDAATLAQEEWNKDPQKYVTTTTSKILVRRARPDMLVKGVN